jgi:hypothetical protein
MLPACAKNLSQRQHDNELAAVFILNETARRMLNFPENSSTTRASDRLTVGNQPTEN